MHPERYTDEQKWKLLKYIDEIYHIENDYLHYLNIMKFNIVPSYISDKVDEIMERFKIEKRL